ncbi:MAG: ABC transporter permease [Chloroflexota bacterium]|nr:ABC transporter permease [Chloroflexota bacterium]
MSVFFVRRLVQSAALLLIVVSGVFFLVHLTPGGPEAALARNPRVSGAELQRLRSSFGLDEPLPSQYLRWLAHVARFDFGTSYFYSRPASEVVGERLGPTLLLGLSSYLVALAGVPLGMLAGLNRGRAVDVVVRLLASIGQSVPTWWLGLSSVVVLGSLTGWFPSSPGQGDPGEWLKSVSVPALVLGLGGLATFARLVRAGVLDALAEEYVRAARAKGLPPRLVNGRHVLRNVLLPVITELAGLLPAVVSGALVTEYVFAWPGTGRLFYEAASSRDYPIVLAVLTLVSAATILGTLLADLAYGMVDPRIRYA